MKALRLNERDVLTLAADGTMYADVEDESSPVGATATGSNVQSDTFSDDSPWGTRQSGTAIERTRYLPGPQRESDSLNVQTTAATLEPETVYDVAAFAVPCKSPGAVRYWRGRVGVGAG